ncbi:polysaccharide deacetylase family protein [Polaribacter sp. R2A056_3_33]|uniref:polysaccharide deacetylase family protein n=1 Tax=Polaribacter sp. R2A056_3_33 TaxID=2745563 RepID=UPI001C4F4513|nr:polysaccharide deacetylase family protein [Polaribacter sp. R2A056_3_33]QXP70740.1 polysaccharide deacetylase family protein [Polaribacter sp. R2A056_3_33]
MIDILMFHRVLPREKIDVNDAYFIRGTLISQERLENIIAQYLKEGFIFKTIINFKENSRSKQVVLTFDDGYIDNFLYVKPILEKYNIKATFYPVIGYCKEQKIAPLDYYYLYVNKNIGSENKEDWIVGKQKKEFLSLSINEQKLFVNTLFSSEPKTKVSYMTTKQLRELQDLDHEIGGHSYYHNIYTKLSKKEIIEDVQRTRKSLQEIGINIKSYAYTDGQYNAKTIDILKAENIDYACAIKSSKLAKNYNYELERIFVTENEII